MGRKIKLSLLAAFLLCALIMPAASADAFYRGTIEHVDAVMPNVDVYFNIIDDNDSIVFIENITQDDVSAMLSGEKLDTASAIPYSQSDKGCAYFFLVDISGSVAADFPEVKQSITTWVDNKKTNDKIVLITFGKEVNVLLDGTETDDVIKQTIAGMEAKDKATKYFDGVYRAINVAQAENSTLPARKIFLVITDGQDYSTGGVTSQELSDAVIESGIPMYNLAVSSSTGDDRSSLGELSRSTGAKLIPLQLGMIAPSFASLQNELNSGYLLTFKSKNNVVDNSVKTLSIDIENETIKLDDSVDIKINEHEADTEAPDFDFIEVLNNQEISISFTEDVEGADKAGNFSITDEDGEYISIDSCSYSNLETKLILDEPITNGDYTLTISNITDISMEQNEMSTDSIMFEASGFEEESVLDDIDNTQLYMFIGIGVLLLILILLLILFAVKKNKQTGAPTPARPANPAHTPDAPQNDIDMGGGKRQPGQVHVKPSSGKKAQLIAVAANGVEKHIELFVEDEIIIGRSTTCDLYFDDVEMSRQHCRITNSGGTLFIEDLNSMNGTVLNGVPLGSRTILNKGDIIHIGNYKIKYED